MKNIFNLIFAVVFIGLLSFVNKKGKDNTLSKKEKKLGFELLFDGNTTNGWKSYKGRPAEGWGVSNGELVCDILPNKKRADFITVDQYENFELKIDWKIEKAHNSGIIYMATEENGASYESGPEYQLIDDLGYPEKLSDKQLSGANYDVNPPMKNVAIPAGNYNTTKIIVNNGHVEHWLNGTKVVDYQLWSPEWEVGVANSKWKDVKPYGRSKKGHIALQDHGGGVSFKNIKIRRL